MLLGDGSWAVEGREFYLNRLGNKTLYQVVHVEYEIELHQQRGLYGQLRRRVLVTKVSDWDEVEAEVKEALRLRLEEA